ncbi:EpsG family protein [Pedobacter sp. SL55]|uniref:EpsG family protein n=1 Tax=Pedobacter sp. SL55 TaxID=2995161 RepID=UPI0022720903|nr:EpsG family protein [Pedobacter sp. SL55]WAC41451.1 EpsG family protein [Pedobacter sp. SL55]
MIYLIIGLLIIALTYVDAITKDRKFSKYTSLFVLAVMLLLVSLRYQVGTDWDAYYDFYKGNRSTDNVEIGYALLNDLFSGLGFHYNFFILVLNIFALTLMFSYLNKNGFLLCVGLLIFFSDLFLYLNLSGIRQGIAIAITCFSINFAINRNFLPFLGCILFAACFHGTALAFLVVYFLPRTKMKFYVIICCAIGFLLCNLFLESISEFITLYTIKSADFYTSQQEKIDNVMNLFYVGIAKRSVIICVILFFGRKMFDLPNSHFFFNIYLFGFGVYLSSYLISPDIGARLSSYFTIFEMLLAGKLLYAMNNINNRVVVVTLFSLMAIYKLLGYMSFETYVYQTIFSTL